VLLVDTQPRLLVYSVTWQSRVRSAYPANNLVSAFYYQPRIVGRVPAVVVLHGYGTQVASTERNLCAYLAARGIGAMLVFLPHHGNRTPRGYQSGELMLRPDVTGILAAVRQAVIDVRCAADWLQQRPEVDPNRIGMVGISLGAILANLIMGVDARFAAAVSVLGGGDVADIIWNSPLASRVRGKLAARGMTLAELRRQLRVIDPITYAERNRPAVGGSTVVAPAGATTGVAPTGAGARPVLMIAGCYDLIVPPSDAKELWRALGKPPIIWASTGHYGPLLVSSRMSEIIADYLLNEFGERTGPLPRLYHYTIKAGLLLNERVGISPAIGVSLAHIGRQGFVDLTLTTDGPMVGVSTRVGELTEFGLGFKIGKRIDRLRPYLALEVVL
jgi:fermentation-respiration switch protein FrsA (DUF1100 family)